MIFIPPVLTPPPHRAEFNENIQQGVQYLFFSGGGHVTSTWSRQHQRQVLSHQPNHDYFMQPHDIDEYERELAAERLLETVLKYLCVRLRLRADRTFHETLNPLPWPVTLWVVENFSRSPAISPRLPAPFPTKLAS